LITDATHPDALLGLIESLADPTRLRLLHLLENRELSVADLCDVLQTPQSTVSRHLKVLVEEGWLVLRRSGTVNLYRMPGERTDRAMWPFWELVRERSAEWSTLEEDRLRLERRLTQREQKSDRFFAYASTQWDRLRHEHYGERFERDAMLGLLDESATVADLGCGTGALSVKLAAWVGRVIGVDRSGAMLEAAERRAEDFPNVELRRGDLEALPIESESCDLALAALVLSYVERLEPVLGEAARILKPGGRLVVVDLLPHERAGFQETMGQSWPGFEPRQLQRRLEGAGLEAGRLTPLEPDPKAKGPPLLLATARRPVDL
jgi:ArsR family transcriptional regulator